MVVIGTKTGMRVSLSRGAIARELCANETAVSHVATSCSAVPRSSLASSFPQGCFSSPACSGCCCALKLHPACSCSTYDTFETTVVNLSSGHDLYGERFEDFQRILAQLKAKDIEREVQAVLDRHPRPFGGAYIRRLLLSPF